MTEYKKKFKGPNIEIEIKAKTECKTQEDLCSALSYFAQISKTAYLDIGRSVKNTL